MPEPAPSPSPLDRPLAVTFFPSFAASEKREEQVSLRALAPRIRTTTAPQKTRLPWLKLASFGDSRHAKEGVPEERQSLRHNANVLSVSGIEGDYDSEIVTVDAALAVLRGARIAGMIYTSPSHTEDAPRWRVLCPLSAPRPPAARTALLERLNGIFQGALSGESFTLSQSYYFGSVNRNPSHRAELVDGDCIDLRPDLDEGAIGKPRPAPAPAAAPQPRKEGNTAYVNAVIDNALAKVRSAPEGQKHRTLRDQARLLGGFQHAGNYSAADAVSWLMAALPASAKDRKAAETTALWGIEQGAARPLQVPDRPTRAEEPPPASPEDYGYGPDMEPDMEPDNVVRFPGGRGEERAEPPGAREAHRPQIDFVWFADIRPKLDAADFVQGLLIEQSAAVIYGASNSGKTFWTTDLSLHVAAGLEWNGRRVEQGGVVYGALEGGIGFRNRVSAWKEEKGLGAYDLPFVAVTSPLNLRDPDADTQPLLDAIRAFTGRMEVPLKLIVIDTLSRAMAGGNENAPEDMGALVMCMDRIRQDTKAAVLFIHHSGKDQAKGARGHSLLQAAIDTEIEVVADEEGGGHTATVVKQREMRKGDVFPFALKVVELGTNRHGEAVTTCLVQQEAQVGQAKPRLSGDKKRALEILVNLLAAQGQPGHTDVPSGHSSVPEKWWRDRFYAEAKPGAEQEAKQRAFRRAADDLIAERRVGMAKNRVWATGRTA